MKRLYSSLTAASVACALLFSSLVAQAQESTVSGSVRDEAGNAMPGVNVVVKGTTTGTATDGAGSYRLTVSGPSAVLVFTFIGYATQEITVGNRTSVDVTMSPDIQTLQELVVTGYASQEKKDLTGSVGTVKMADLTQIPAASVTNQLQGRVAGVTVSGDGRPGVPAKVRIRGFSSFLNNAPLYVIDGVPTQDISNINPGDIESMSVLKDAGAASIYGSRASNGVIVVTTKRGTRSGVKVNYDMYIGTQDPGDKPDFLLNAQEMADLQWLVYDNDGTVETHPVYGPSSNASPTMPVWAGDTDWYKEITQSALIMNHDLSLQGGNDNSRFYAGINYFNQEGIIITNFQKRYSVRFNSEFKIKDRVRIGENISVSGRNGLGVNGIGNENSPLARVLMQQPIIPAIVDQNITGISHNFVPGEFGGTGIAVRLGNGPNPLADLTRDAEDRQQDVRAVGSAYVDVKLIEGLNFRTTFGGTYQSGYNTNWTGATYERAENQATSSYGETGYYNSDWNWHNTLTYDKTFGSNKLLAVAGYEANKYGIGRGVTASRAGYFSDNPSFRTVSNGAQITGATSGYNTPITLQSMFLRADYGYNDKYLISATIRRDGSSVFGEDNRYGTFPSVSAGWRVSEESFLAGTEFISDLKIRGGYGTMGNQLAVSAQNQFYTYGGGTGETNYDLNGSGSASLQGFRPTQIGNPDAKWETNVTTNIGFDAGFMDNKFQITFDWYNKQTQDLLFNPALPGTAGAATQPFVNIAEMKNSGIDLQLIYRENFSPDLKFEGNLTFTTYNNEIVKVADGIDYFFWNIPATRIGAFNRNEVGHSMGEFYGYQVMGLFQSSSEVSGAPTQAGAEEGFFRYQDTDGNNTIDDLDRVFIGNPNPDFTYGLNLSLSYKMIDFTAFLYGSVGNEIFNYNRWWTDFWPSFQNEKSTDLLYNSWTPTNTGATTPKASNISNFSNNTQSVSYYVENGSFARLKNLQIGFTFPKATISKLGLTNARIYVQGVNLFTITDYTGLDPDLNTGDDRAFGVDLGAYPLVKTYTVGVNIGF